MYQVKNGAIPNIFNNDFSTVDHAYPTRFALNSCQLPRSSKTPRFSILLHGPKLWNQFITNEKDITTLGSFKRLLKKKILDFNNELIFF